MLAILNLRSDQEDILSTILPKSVTQGLRSTAGLRREAPHGVRAYLPPTLFAYLVEQAEQEGESLSSMIVDLPYGEFDSQNL
jgi:hypothetical protein